MAHGPTVNAAATYKIASYVLSIVQGCNNPEMRQGLGEERRLGVAVVLRLLAVELQLTGRLIVSSPGGLGKLRPPFGNQGPGIEILDALLKGDVCQAFIAERCGLDSLQTHDTHLDHALPQHIQLLGGRMGQVDDPTANKGSAVINAHRDRASVVQTRDDDPRAKGQVPMRRR
jgi:hypothetical protein